MFQKGISSPASFTNISSRRYWKMFQLQQQQQAMIAEADLPGRREWVEMRSFMGIWFWNLLECLDFLQLSPATQGKLPGSFTTAVSRLAVRMRIFAIFEAYYIEPQYKGTHIGHRGPYEVLKRQLMAHTYNLTQAKAGVLDPVLMKAGNGRTMNSLIQDVQDKMVNNLSSRHWKGNSCSKRCFEKSPCELQRWATWKKKKREEKSLQPT